MTTTHTVVLVSCVGRKLDHAAPAQDLYQSQWFKLARTYAETHGNAWYILSAKFGLVAPTSVIAPYEQSLSGSHKARDSWARDTASQIRTAIDPQTTGLVMLAGLRYRYPLLEWLKGYQIRVPMYGLGIGQQLHWLKQQEVA